MTHKGPDQHPSNHDSLVGLHVNVDAVNARLAKYRPLIDELAREQTPQRFNELLLGSAISKNFFTWDNTDLPRVERKLRGVPLIDIGAGYASNIRDLAKKADVPFLIEIEKFYPHEDTEWEDVLEGGLHIIRFRTDILEVLARLPDAWANVVMNGIDHALIPAGEYREAMLREITRVVRPSGVFLGYDSDIAFDDRYRDPMPDGFIRSDLDDERNVYGKFFAFEKKKSMPKRPV
jgi:hypothetical protein